MHPGVVIRYEGERGCGRRKTGGLYLVADGPARGCGKLPIPLEVCPCCGQGFKPSRAPQWIEQPERLWNSLDCDDGRCSTCPMSNAFESGPALMIWVGEKYYKTSMDFTKESALMGISRRIKHIPQKFKVGETWVLLAHRKAVEIAPLFSAKPHWQPGIFAMFLPQRIEIIIRGDEPDSVIDGYIERGLTPVLIKQKEEADEPDISQGSLL
jgi:hypothetical protein